MAASIEHCFTLETMLCQQAPSVEGVDADCEPLRVDNQRLVLGNFVEAE